MGTKEMSDTFDILYNNITSNQAPGLNEMEKSVFLTKAQDELVKNYFVPEGNPHQKGFDGSQKRQIDFSMLMEKGSGKKVSQTYGTIDPRAISYTLPDNIMYIINESIVFSESAIQPMALEQEEEKVFETKPLAIRQVIPLAYDEYSRLMSKPFKEPLKYQAWRLITDKNVSGLAKADIIITSDDRKKYADKSINYIIRYVRRPNPIILIDLTDSFGEDLSIHGESKATECELDPAIHEEILQRAVELAKVAWQGDLQSVTQAGQRSE